MFLTALVALCGACLLATPATARPLDGPRSPDLQPALDGLVERGVPGAILFVRDGGRTSRLTSGVADIAEGRPMRPGDRVRIASLTKTYTAAVVLQLVGEGKLRLGDSVEQWLPGLVPNGDAITVHHLLSHTSGIFDFEFDPRVIEPYLAGDFAHYWAPRELVEMAVSHEPLFAPGETTSAVYSSTNYVIAGLIVESVTGNTMGSELARRIFRPLGLRASSYPTTPEIEGAHAHGYMLLGAPPLVDVTGISPSLSPASGAIVSDARDVAVFYRGLLAGRLLEPGLLRAMKTTLPEAGGNDPRWRYGLGLRRFTTSCGHAWGHTGAFPGYLTFAYSSANGRRQAVLMANLDGTSFTEDSFGYFVDLIDRAYCSA
jgi:D-alanyl-D-alanine carboxypeptidase